MYKKGRQNQNCMCNVKYRYSRLCVTQYRLLSSVADPDPGLQCGACFTQYRYVQRADGTASFLTSYLYGTCTVPTYRYGTNLPVRYGYHLTGTVQTYRYGNNLPERYGTILLTYRYGTNLPVLYQLTGTIPPYRYGTNLPVRYQLTGTLSYVRYRTHLYRTRVRYQ